MFFPICLWGSSADVWFNNLNDIMFEVVSEFYSAGQCQPCPELNFFKLWFVLFAKGFGKYSWLNCLTNFSLKTVYVNVYIWSIDRYMKQLSNETCFFSLFLLIEIPIIATQWCVGNVKMAIHAHPQIENYIWFFNKMWHHLTILMFFRVKN